MLAIVIIIIAKSLNNKDLVILVNLFCDAGDGSRVGVCSASALPLRCISSPTRACNNFGDSSPCQKSVLEMSIWKVLGKRGGKNSQGLLCVMAYLLHFILHRLFWMYERQSRNDSPSPNRNQYLSQSPTNSSHVPWEATRVQVGKTGTHSAFLAPISADSSPFLFLCHLCTVKVTQRRNSKILRDDHSHWPRVLLPGVLVSPWPV